MKRVVTIQDLSCVGKCSLTVALPIISACGVESAVIPTAVLSAHTAFDGFRLHDLSENIDAVADHWREQKLRFDGIYTGYLATPRQLETLKRFIGDFGEGAFVLVDPVMGDFGRLYAGFEADFPQKMLTLISRSDITVPNITEACALSGKEMKATFSEEEICDMAKIICESGARSAVVTGFSPSPGKLGIVKYDAESGRRFTYYGEKIETDFPLHGTGDIFASVCAGAMARGVSPDGALALAVDFTAECVRATVCDVNRRWYGVNFEDRLSCLIRMLEEKLNG